MILGRRLTLSLCFTVLAAVLALAPPALAAEKARLQVTHGEGADTCPRESALGDAVAARLGYDPFVTDAPRTVVVAFRRDSSNLTSIVQMVDAGGVRGERALASPLGDCEELASATALTISILLDPRSGLLPPPPLTVNPEPDAVNPEKAARADRAREPERAQPAPRIADEPVHLLLSALAQSSVGAAPAPAVGVLAGIGVAHRWWSIAAELRVDLPASAPSGSLTPRTALTAGNIVPCGHFWRAYACTALTLGVLRGEIVEATTEKQASFHAMIGPRLGMQLPLVAWLSLDGHIDASYALTTTSLRGGTREVWTTAAISGLLAFGFVGRFP